MRPALRFRRGRWGSGGEKRTYGRAARRRSLARCAHIALRAAPAVSASDISLRLLNRTPRRTEEMREFDCLRLAACSYSYFEKMLFLRVFLLYNTQRVCILVRQREFADEE